MQTNIFAQLLTCVDKRQTVGLDSSCCDQEATTKQETTSGHGFSNSWGKIGVVSTTEIWPATWMQTSYFSQLVSCLFSIVLVPTNIKGPLANQCCCNAPWTVDIVACWHKDIVTRHVFTRTWWQYIYSKGHGDKTCLQKEMVTFWHDKRHAKRFPLSYQWPWWQTLGRWPSPGSSQRLQTQQNHALWKKKNINIFLFLILHLEPLKFSLFTHPVPGWWFGPNLVINIFWFWFCI